MLKLQDTLFQDYFQDLYFSALRIQDVAGFNTNCPSAQHICTRHARCIGFKYCRYQNNAEASSFTFKSLLNLHSCLVFTILYSFTAFGLRVKCIKACINFSIVQLKLIEQPLVYKSYISISEPILVFPIVLLKLSLPCSNY